MDSQRIAVKHHAFYNCRPMMVNSAAVTFSSQLFRNHDYLRDAQDGSILGQDPTLSGMFKAK